MWYRWRRASCVSIGINGGDVVGGGNGGDMIDDGDGILVALGADAGGVLALAAAFIGGGRWW